MEKKISVIASSNYSLSAAEQDNVRGGRAELEMAARGCACCICNPNQSASGGAKYASSFSGGHTIIKSIDHM